MALKNCGALWKPKKEGKVVLSGEIDLGVGGTARVMVFKNDKKEKPGHPDYRIALVMDDDEEGSTAGSGSGGAQESDNPPF